MVKVEVCAGNVSDCIKAEASGADQIELNSGLFLGGLTPSLATLKLAKEKVNIPIYPMLRVRGGGFCYDEIEVETMRQDAHHFAQAKADGLVFGFLNEDRTVDKNLTKEFVAICKEYGIDSIYHRAFDNVVDPYSAMETLIDCGVNRVLTSGLADSAAKGMTVLKKLQDKYGGKIEIIVGAGVNQDNVQTIIQKTGVRQIHSSFKKWETDPTTTGQDVSYAFSDLGSYDVVDEAKVKALVALVK